MKVNMAESLSKSLKPDGRMNNLSLNLVQSNLKGMNPAYSIHQPLANVSSPLSTPSPSSLNHDSLYSTATSATSMDSSIGLLQFDMKNPGIPITTNGIPQNMAVAAAATAIGNSQTNSFAVQKQQALQAQFNNAMSAGSAKAVQQQHQQLSMMQNQFQPAPHMLQQQPIFQVPQNMQGMVYGPGVQRPQMVGPIRQGASEQDLYNMQSRIQQQPQLKLQMQQMQLQQAQQQFRNQQPIMQQQQQQQPVIQKQARMLAPSMNQQFAFRPQPGIPTQMGPVQVGQGLRVVKSSPMVSQMVPQMHNQIPHQMSMHMPNQISNQNQMASPSSAPSNSLAAAAAAAALSARQNAYRVPNQPGTRVRRSFSTSSPLAQSQSSPSQKVPPRSSKPAYSNGNTPTTMHFPTTDLSASVLSPNSPTFQISQYPSPSTTVSEIDAMDDGSTLMSPTVSPFLSNMPAIRFPAEVKRPSTEYSVDEVIANAELEMNGDKPKRRRSNAHGQPLSRRLSSASESGQLSLDTNSPGNSGSPPSTVPRKPPTPTQTAAGMHLNQRRSLNRYASNPAMQSPKAGQFSPTSSAAAPKDNHAKVNTSSAGNTSFGGQGQQLVFPLNPIQGNSATFEHESIVSFSDRNDNGASSVPRGRARAVSANGMGRFEVLTFHQYEKPMTLEDKRLKQQQKSAAVPAKNKKENVNSESKGSSPVPKVEKSVVVTPPKLLRVPSSLGLDNSGKRVSMVKEEDEEEVRAEPNTEPSKEPEKLDAEKPLEENNNGSSDGDDFHDLFPNGSEEAMYLFEPDDTTIFSNNGAGLDEELNKFMDYSFDMVTLDGTGNNNNNNSTNLMMNDATVVGDDFIDAAELGFNGSASHVGMNF